MSSKSDLLVLHIDELSTRAEAFYERLEKSPSELALFITNPGLVIGELFFGGEKLTTPQEIDKTNRVIYALLSNRKFHAWVAKYQQDLYDELAATGMKPRSKEGKHAVLQILGRRRLMRDFAAGMKEWGDTEIFQAVISPSATDDDNKFTVLLINTVVVLVQVYLAIDYSTITHVSSSTETANDSHAISSSDFILVHDHVLFTIHDAFFDHSANANSIVNASANTNANATTAASANAVTSANADANTNSNTSSDADSESDANSDVDSDSDSESDSDSASDSSSESGSASDSSGISALFGFSRVELQQFAGLVARGLEAYARTVRVGGALASEVPLGMQERTVSQTASRPARKRLPIAPAGATAAPPKARAKKTKPRPKKR